MKTNLRAMVLLCLLGTSTPPLHAQEKVTVEDEMPNGIVIVTIDKAGDEIIRIMHESQLPYFHDPQAPRFLLMDKRGKFALGIGGYVRATAEYDFGGIANSIDFIPATILGSAGKIKNQFQMDASTASIFLKLVGHTDLLGDFIVYTAGNFRGDGRTLKLRNAYITFHDITIGYTYGTFSDAAAMPTTVDYQGPNGAAIYRATQIAYHYKGIKNLRLEASIEMPEVDGTTKAQLQIAQQRMPDFSVAIQYSRSEASHLRLATILRRMTYTTSLSEKASDITGYGIQASGTCTLKSALRLYGQITYGKGIGQYFNDLSQLNVDLVPNPTQEGKMQVLPMLGWFAGARYNLSPKLFLSATYSLSRLYSDNHWPQENSYPYRYGQYLATNLFWHATPNMEVGTEYLRGWRTDFSNTTRHTNRLNLLVQYSF
ncbi:MAG: porin [Bacteroides sp.]|nr:porin [Bacteroides sp.]